MLLPQVFNLQVYTLKTQFVCNLEKMEIRISLIIIELNKSNLIKQDMKMKIIFFSILLENNIVKDFDIFLARSYFYKGNS